MEQTLDGPLALERARHNETKKALNNASQRMQRLHDDLEDRNSDMEDFRIEIGDLKGKLKEAEEKANESEEKANEFEKRLHTMTELESQLASQAVIITGFKAEQKHDIEERRRTEMEVASRNTALLQANRDLDKALLLANAKLNKRQDEVEQLRAELAAAKETIHAAKETIVARDESLTIAENEKKDLQTCLFDIRHQMENATAVMGEASIAFHSEVTNCLSLLQATNKLGIPLAALPRR